MNKPTTYNPTQLYKTINSFFIDYGEEETRKLLWDLFKAGICGSFEELDVRDRQILVSFYEALDHLLGELMYVDIPGAEGDANLPKIEAS